MKLLYEKQSPYKLIQVVEEEDGVRYLMLEGRTEIHSEYNPSTILLHPVTEHYWNFLSLFSLVSDSIKKVLIVGMGAGTISRQMIHYRSDLHIEGIEIDKEITKVGKEYFHMPSSVVIHHQDAVSFLENCSETFDYIILDAFIEGNLGQQFCTPDFISLCKSHLTPEGILGINYLDERPVNYMISDSMKNQFSFSFRVCIPGTYNYVIFASEKEYDLNNLLPADEDIKRLKNYIIRYKE